jgi:THO complex subunit 3
VVSGGEEDRGVEISHVESGESVHKIESGPAPIVQWSPKDYSLAYAINGETASNSGLRIVGAANLI